MNRSLTVAAGLTGCLLSVASPAAAGVVIDDFDDDSVANNNGLPDTPTTYVIPSGAELLANTSDTFSGDFTDNGIDFTVTFTTNGGANWFFNVASGFFGSLGIAGGGAQINPGETFTVLFTSDVELTAFALSLADPVNFGNAGGGIELSSVDNDVTAAGFGPFIGDGPHALRGVTLDAETPLVFTAVGDEPFLFQSLTINAVPEPASLALIAMGLGLSAWRRHR